ncbi:hypothetical protein LOTGIDRAFT_168872 [Lottia gigantea]|uniref:Uncharacterized protein n=1 Tax=Lottia gigantea TaxID=225164 RepID=V3ZU22_LOTGI|nr:hypothetical protein LOTGIDRAFT_168872 [Lottia gigantea]ESO84416.1 hypothetical protein LOTGIDRAFT_168872 [Lottia gigantea]
MGSTDLETDGVAMWEKECSRIVDNYDAAIVYSEKDVDEAKHIMEKMNNLELGNGRRPFVCLYDNPQFSPSIIKRPCCLVNKCLFLFCLLTKNFREDKQLDLVLDEALGITLLATCGNCGIPATSVQRNMHSVRPLHTRSQATRDYTIPSGLTTITGFDLSKPSCWDDLRYFFNCFKNDKCFLNGCVPTSNVSASDRTASARAASEITASARTVSVRRESATTVSETPASARYAATWPFPSTAPSSALALPKQELSLNSNQIPQISAGCYPSNVTSKEPSLFDGQNLSEKKECCLEADLFNLNSKDELPQIMIDSAYHSNKACASTSYNQSFSISERGNQVNGTSNSDDSGKYSSRNTDLMVQEPPMEVVHVPNRRFFSKASEIIENGTLVTYGNSSRSSRSLEDPGALLFPMKKKPSRKPKSKKRVTNLVGCNIVQFSNGAQHIGNSYKGKFSPQKDDDDSDSEWSNEDPMTLSIKNIEGSDKQESAGKNVVPSDSIPDQPNVDQLDRADNFDLFSQDDNATTAIDESRDSLQQSISTESWTDSTILSHTHQGPNGERFDSVIAAAYHDSNEENPPDDLQEALSREEPLSLGSIGCVEAAGGRAPIIVNQDQLGFIGAEEIHLHRFSQPGTSPFSYHSLHSNHLPDRQMSFVDVARLTGLYESVSVQTDELD